MTQEKTIWRVFSREEGNPYTDFDSVMEAWNYAQELGKDDHWKIGYVHTIKPGGRPYPR